MTVQHPERRNAWQLRREVAMSVIVAMSVEPELQCGLEPELELELESELELELDFELLSTKAQKSVVVQAVIH